MIEMDLIVNNIVTFFLSLEKLEFRKCYSITLRFTFDMPFCNTFDLH